MIAQAVIQGVTSILDKAIVDKDAKAKAQHDIEALLVQQPLQQIAVNKQEAAHKSLFVAGGRPALIWIGALAIFYTHILYPFLRVILIIADPTFPVDQLPTVDMGDIMPLILGLIGLGGLRTYEKLKGVAREQ